VLRDPPAVLGWPVATPLLASWEWRTARRAADVRRMASPHARAHAAVAPRRALRDAGLSGAVALAPPMKTVLVVDDERQIAEIARDYLQHAGYAVITATDGAMALDLARTRQPDLVVLDLALPRVDGLDVARALRRESDIPIIMLTARVEESDRLLVLEIGADDYITKPFSPRELVARVKAV